ncbi:MAG: hypothetical protein P8104_09720, partial [Gammaproteobacteria bacterium]
QTYQALMSGTSSDDSLNRQTFSQRIKNSLSEINQERWLLHIGGWSQLLNGLDHFMQMGGQHIPRFALSTAFVYASAMSAAEVPHAWHAARDYRYARKAEKDLETFLDKWPLDPDHPKDILARSVRADMREDHHNDANAAFWTSFVNTAFATSMVSVLLGLVTAAAAPSHSIDSNNQHGLGHAQNQKDFSTFVPPVMYGFLASFWLSGMTAHVVAATRQYINHKNQKAIDNNTNLDVTTQTASNQPTSSRLPSAPPVASIETLEAATNPQQRSLFQSLKNNWHSLMFMGRTG